MKKYECVVVALHKDVGKPIVEWEKNGWRLYTYQTAYTGEGFPGFRVDHYLLFEKES